MQLYHSPASPFVRKVAAVILELGLSDQVEFLPASGTALSPGTMPVDKNPLGKIPTLLLNDGQALYDSRVICRYLDSLAGGVLYPEARLWRTLTLEATADGVMDAAILMVYEARVRPEERRYEPWVEAQWTKINRALTAVEENWGAHLNGPVDMGQIALGCALGYLDFRHPNRAWREGRPNLAAWEAAFAVRPAMKATAPGV